VKEREKNGMVDLVVKLVKENVIKTSRVAEIMVKVDRKDYYRGSGPYKDRPQEIGYEGRISAPHMHAHALVSNHIYIESFHQYLHFIGILLEEFEAWSKSSGHWLWNRLSVRCLL